MLVDPRYFRFHPRSRCPSAKRIEPRQPARHCLDSLRNRCLYPPWLVLPRQRTAQKSATTTRYLLHQRRPQLPVASQRAPRHPRTDSHRRLHTPYGVPCRPQQHLLSRPRLLGNRLCHSLPRNRLLPCSCSRLPLPHLLDCPRQLPHAHTHPPVRPPRHFQPHHAARIYPPWPACCVLPC